MLRLLNKPWVVVLLTAAVVAVASILKVVLNPVVYDGVNHAPYNNFVIFRNAFLNLLAHRDLYAWHLDQQWDLYKYSPAFAVFMAPFAYLPTLPGVVAWNLLNALALVFAIRRLPFSEGVNHAIVYLVLVELVTSVQSAQSNGLVAALFLLTLILLERRQVGLAALCTVLNTSIKVFGVAGFALFLLYPQRRKAALYALLWLAVVAAVPLLVVGPAELATIYGRWFTLLREDTARANSVSFYGWLVTWFGLTPPRTIVLAASTAVLVLPFVRISRYGDGAFRLLALASVLLWVVIFNHKAESPTFVIAMCGIAIWFFTGPVSSLRCTLLGLAFVFVSLSPTDIFPRWVREHLLVAYSMKAVPCILVWVLVSARLLFSRERSAPARPGNAAPAVQ